MAAAVTVAVAAEVAVQRELVGTKAAVQVVELAEDEAAELRSTMGALEGVAVMVTVAMAIRSSTNQGAAAAAAEEDWEGLKEASARPL